MRKFVGVLSLLVFGPVCVARCDTLVWPQFRGPHGSGIAAGQNPPVTFGPEKNVLWKVPAPSGFSSPVVVGNKLVITAFDNHKLYTVAYDRADGKEVWRTEAPADKIEAYHKTEGSPAASSVATDGQHIVAYFGSCGLFCYDTNGRQLWHLKMPTAVTVADFGTGVSPIIAKDTAVLVRDEKSDPKIVAANLADGSIRWEKKRQSISGYATPVVWDTPDGTQIVAPGYGKMIGYDLKTGEEKWYVVGMPSACCASPVVSDGMLLFAAWSPGDSNDSDFKMPSFDDILKQAGEEKLGYMTRAGSEKTMMKNFFDNNDTNKDGKITREEWDASLKFMSTSKNSAFALKPGGSGDITNSHIVWTKKKGLPYVPSAVACAGQYVLVKDGGLVTAYDAKTGDELYVQERAVASGRYYASPVVANGNIYFTELDTGAITVLKAGTKKPTVVAKNPKFGERIAATPAFADDNIYIRTASHLYAIGEKK